MHKGNLVQIPVNSRIMVTVDLLNLEMPANNRRMSWLWRKPI